MDLQRLFISLALAVVTYLLILQWNADYDRPAGQPSAPTAQVEPPGAVPQPPDTPADAGDGSPATDIPAHPVADTAPAETPAQPPVDEPPDRFVVITTDTYRIRIDLLGGDLVSASLPRYPLHVDTPDEPFPLLSQVPGQLYVVQSGLVGRDGPDARPEGRPRYRTSQGAYVLPEGAESMHVDLTWEAPDGRQRIRKRYLFQAGSYQVGVRIRVENTGDTDWAGNFYGQIKRNGHPDPSSGNAGMAMATYLGAAFFTPDKPYHKVDLDDMEDAAEERADRLAFKQTIPGGWVAFLQHYFVTAWVPAADQNNSYYARSGRGDTYLVGFTSPAQTVAPGETSRFDATLYVGPKIQSDLADLSPGLELTVDYGWLWFLAQPLFWLLQFLHGFAGNWGLAIILITIVIKLAFFQLSAASYRSMANMRRIQPELLRLKELHGEDRQRMSQEMMELYKREKINPLGGCLPILVQIPVFIALYWVLMESVELRQAPFYGWIQDLSVKDPYFVLPIAMGLTMFFQQMLNPAPPDPTQAMVLKILPIMFTFFFLWFPAGLVLYWLVNNILSIAQQWVITRRVEQAAKPQTK